MIDIRDRRMAPGVVLVAFMLAIAAFVPALAQEATPDPIGEGALPVAAMHVGSCTEFELTPIADLGVLSPFGMAPGQEEVLYRGVPTEAAPVMSSNVTIDLSFDEVFDGVPPHVLAIHESVGSFGTLIACGEVHGAEADGRVVVGLRPMSETGPAGIAILDSDTTDILGLGEGQTQIAIYMVSDLGIAAPADEAAENGAAAAAQDEEAAPAEEEDAAQEEAAEATPVAEDEEAAQEEGEAAAPADEEANGEAEANGENGEGAAAEAVTIEAIDIDFTPSEFSIPANTDVPVTIVNNGSIEHTFTIDELGIDEVLPPGEEIEITINADAGEYVYYCTVPGHREAGQEGTMTVE